MSNNDILKNNIIDLYIIEQPNLLLYDEYIGNDQLKYAIYGIAYNAIIKYNP